MFELLLDFTGKAMATALVLFLVSRVAERLGPFMASVLMAMPMNAGPGYFFVSLEVSPQFLSKGALMSFAATGGVLVFTGFYIQSTRRFSFLESIGIASLGWLAAVWILGKLEANFQNAMITVMAGLVIGIMMRRPLDLFSNPSSSSKKWSIILLRSAAGGLSVAAIATTASMLGPEMTGLLFGYPITFVATAWMLSKQYGIEFSAATLQSAQLTVSAYVSFCLVLHFAADPEIGGFTGLESWGMGIGASLLVGIIIGGVGIFLRRTSKTGSENSSLG